MSHSRSFIRLMRKTSLILLLTLTIIMLLHILITIFLYTTPYYGSTQGSIFNAVLLVFLYYVIPIIILLCFCLITNRLVKLENAYYEKKHLKKKHTRTKKTMHAPQSNAEDTK